MDRDINPAAAKIEFHLEIRFPGSVALPRPLELGLVNQAAEFRYEPLHCNHPVRRVITPRHSKSLRDFFRFRLRASNCFNRRFWPGFK